MKPKATLHQKILDYAILLHRLWADPDPAALSHAESAQKELTAYAIAQNGLDGLYWWGVPISEVLEAMTENTVGEDTFGGWRIEENFRCKVSDGIIGLYIEEEGHFSDFSAKRNTDSEIVSKYSAAEREAMVAQYNERRNSQEFWDSLTTEGKVYSPTYDKVYNSAADYYNSWEHRAQRQSDSDFYAGTLVNTKITTTTTVHSNSQHYRSLHSIAQFAADDDGRLLAFCPTGIAAVASTGSGKDYAGIGLTNKNAQALCAEFLANDTFVKEVPIHVLDPIFSGEAGSYTEALANAVAVTKLAEKLRFSDFEEAPRSISQAQADACNALFKKINGGTALTEQETVTLLHGAVNNGLRMEFPDMVWIKVSLLYDLATMHMDDMSRCCYYSHLCVDTVKRILPQIQNPAAVEQLMAIGVVTGGICAEAEFICKRYAQCYPYADIVEEYLEKLYAIAPTHPVFRSARTYKKLLKKIAKQRAKARKK